MKTFLIGTLCGLLALSFAGCASVEPTTAPTPPASPTDITHVRLLLPAELASCTIPSIRLDKTPLSEVIEMLAALDHAPGEQSQTIFAARMHPFAPVDLLFMDGDLPTPAWEQFSQKPPFTATLTLDCDEPLSIAELFSKLNEQLPSARVEVLTPEE